MTDSVKKTRKKTTSLSDKTKVLKKAFLAEHFFDLHIGIHNFRLSSTKDSLYGLTVKGGKLKRKLKTRREGKVGQKYWPCAHVHKLLSICWGKVLPHQNHSLHIFQRSHKFYLFTKPFNSDRLKKKNVLSVQSKMKRCDDRISMSVFTWSDF